MRTTLRDNNAFDECPTAHTRLTCTAIDLNMFQVRSGPVERVAVSAERRATMFDAGYQSALDTRMQSRQLIGSEAGGGPQGVNPRAEQCLISVDVAQTGDDGLIEQRALDRAADGGKS